MSLITNLASQFSALQQAALGEQVAVAVQGKTLDAARQQGQAMADLLQQVAQMSKSQHTGRRLDLTA